MSAAARLPLRLRMAQRGLDGVTLLVLPAVFFILLLFVYPFLYGLVLSFQPKAGNWLANYTKFFADPYLYDTIWKTLAIAVPVTVLNVALSIPVALRVRKMKHQRLLTTILVIPITLGTVLVAEGLLNYLGPRGWLNRVLLALHLEHDPIRLVHNYWGVFLSLVITGFPFTFLLVLSYVTGIDPSLEQAAAMLGARARARFNRILLPLLVPGLAITFCLSFVQAFSVFPSAVLLGAPAGATRVISIAAYQAAFEDYDYSMASAIAMIMALVQVLIVVLLLAGQGLFTAVRPAAGKADATTGGHGRKALGARHLAAGRVFRGQPAGDDRHRGGELVRLALARHLVPRGIHHTLVWLGLDEFQLPDVLSVTMQVVAAVVVLAGLIGVPAAYAMARRDFPGKQFFMLLFLLPLLVPPITFGIPLATVLYRVGAAGTIWGVILANLVPTVPFVILIMIPFINQIDPRVEAAARVFGAGTFRLFTRVLVPLLLPGILASLLLVLVRTIAMFELTFLTAGSDSQTLVVALYYAVFSAGVRPGQSIDAMAVVYMATTLIWLLIALRFVNPTQIVTRAKKS